MLVGVALVLISCYANLTHRRTAWANGIVNPILVGDRIGQSFVARYDNLSGVEVWLGTYGRGASPTRASLVLHLKTSPSAPADLRTVVLPSDQPLGENPWHTFSFQPIAGSQNKTFYIEIESPDGRPDNALTAYWWQSDPQLPTDSYPYGMAYRNGRPVQGDLAFGLRYSPAPISAFAQMARAASVNFPPLMMVTLLISSVVLVVWACRLMPSLSVAHRSPSSCVLFVLFVGLVNGLAYLLLVPPWQGPDEHGHFTYAALLDRYGMDDSRVQALQWWEGGADRDVVLQIKNTVWTSMQEHRWTYGLIGYPAPGSTAPPLGSSPEQSDFVWQIRQPATYYLLSVAAVRAARALGLPVDFQSTPDAALLVMRGLALALMLGVVALGWVVGGWLFAGARGGRWLRLLMPLTLALLPMHAFIGTSGDNDVLAELAGSALFVAIVALLRWPAGWKGLVLAGGVAVAAPACALTKSTAVVAALWLGGGGLLLWAGMQVAGWMDRLLANRALISMPARSKVVPLAVLAGFALIASVAIWLAFEPDERAAGWESGGTPTTQAPRVRTPDAYDGAYVLALAPGQQAYQWVELSLHPTLTVTLSFQVRQAGSGGTPAQASVVVDQRGRLPVIGADTLSTAWYTMPITDTVPDQWTSHSLTVPVNWDDRKVLVRFVAGDRPVQFDGISLTARPADPVEAGRYPRGEWFRLFNPSAETGVLRLKPWLSRFVPDEEENILYVLINPQSYDRLAIAQRFAYRQFRSFWGNFGWVSIPLPEALYRLIEVVVVLALGGLGVVAISRMGRWSWREWLGLLSLVALVGGIMMSWARQVAPAGGQGVFTDPFGRYLFPFMLPIVWLLVSGLAIAWSQVARLGRKLLAPGRAGSANRHELAAGHTDGPRAAFMPWGAWLWFAALALFTAYCLLALIGPYYYGY
jgi:hypothetical protein